MFIDRAIIEVRSGKGGDGAIAFLHEKYVANGGPSGGNGGKGGDVILIATPTINSLFNFRHSKVLAAMDGEKGDIKNRYGRNGKDYIAYVPVGTVILDEATHELLFDLSTPNQQVIIAKGGRGGRGNAAFKSDRNRVPKIAENGLPGIRKRVILELKLIADIGLVGLPSVGKSTLLSIVTSAKPEIADYPFTTKSPNLGVVNYKNYESFLLADLPGLIENAHKGKGLGLEFLRHIERCRVLVHVVSMDGETDPIKAYKTINNELKEYDLNLLKRPMIVVASKMDADGAIERKKAFEKAIKKKVISLSALTNEGINELLDKCIETLANAPKVNIKNINEKKIKIYDARKDEAIFDIIKVKDNEWRIIGDSILRTYSLINISTDEGLMRLLTYLRKIGVDDRLETLGAKDGDTVYLADFTFEYTK